MLACLVTSVWAGCCVRNEVCGTGLGEFLCPSKAFSGSIEVASASLLVVVAGRLVVPDRAGDGWYHRRRNDWSAQKATRVAQR